MDPPACPDCARYRVLLFAFADRLWKQAERLSRAAERRPGETSAAAELAEIRAMLRKALELPGRPPAAPRACPCGAGRPHRLRRAGAARRLALARHLAAHGPQRQADLARLVGAKDNAVMVLCAGHPWFERAAGGGRSVVWGVTDAGRAAAGDGEER
jgi:hypothetical protein